MIEQKPFTTTATVVDVSADANIGYRGFHVRETAGAAAIVIIRETSSTGEILDSIGLAALESKHVLYPEPIRCDGDIHVTVTGTVTGHVRYQ